MPVFYGAVAVDDIEFIVLDMATWKCVPDESLAAGAPRQLSDSKKAGRFHHEALLQVLKRQPIAALEGKGFVQADIVYPPLFTVLA